MPKKPVRVSQSFNFAETKLLESMIMSFKRKGQWPDTPEAVALARKVEKMWARAFEQEHMP